MEWNTANYTSGWIKADSYYSHKKTAVHIAAVQNKAKREAEAQRSSQNQQPSNVEPYQGAVLTSPYLAKALDPQRKINDQETHDKEQESMFWDNWVPSATEFDMDRSTEMEHEQRRKAFEHQLDEFLGAGEWESRNTEGSRDADVLAALEAAWATAEEDELVAEILQNKDPYAPEDDDATSHHDSEWYPYPSKLIFLLDTIDNLPRLRISTAFMRTMLWMLKELGIRNVPSYDSFKKIQKEVRQNAGITTSQRQSPKGNLFSFNNPCDLIAKDWANPDVCDHIRRYPVIPSNGCISEIWHAQKWHSDLDRHVLSPMYDDKKGRHYFIDEPAMLDNGCMVIPVRWLEDEEGVGWCEVWEVKDDSTTRTSTIVDDVVSLIEVKNLRKNMLDLQDEGILPVWCEKTIKQGHVGRMPNPNRALAEGDPIYVNFVDIFGDDVSGNRSKSWNKHWNMYMAHRNLPRKLLNHQFHIHFISTSTVATIPEQFIDVKEAILYPDQILLDIQPGRHRSSSETLGRVKEQVYAACTGVAATVEKLQATTGVKDAYTQHWVDNLIARARDLKKANPQWTSTDVQNHLKSWVDDNEAIIFNPFLTLEGFDAAQDTPVEILHTILLGVVKYVWHGSFTTWNAAHKALYSSRLQATNSFGLGENRVIRAKYITQYANSLIGRQLKILAQVNTFHVYDLVSENQFLLTKAIGELSALLWYPEIRNMDQYLADVSTAAANVLDIAALIDPSKIVAKIKYHLLTHLVQDIKRFGPLVGMASEVYEAFNGIFRYCSIFSNHLAPSRDIAVQLADQECIKHILCGGWWKNKATEDWVHQENDQV
ncbi:hypothetical protein CVT24_010098, partial [Panaeolus cyanescens]